MGFNSAFKGLSRLLCCTVLNIGLDFKYLCNP